jgi:hypothetical protein
MKFDYFEGRIYIAVAQNYGDWEFASRTARAAGGHLVTISSEEENQFVAELFSTDDRFILIDPFGSSHGPAIGLYQLPNSDEPAGGWTWETGEPIAYSNWDRPHDQPSNFKPDFSYGHFFRDPDRTAAGKPILQWGDIMSDISGRGFIMEID